MRLLVWGKLTVYFCLIKLHAIKLGTVLDMLSIYEIYCDLTIGKRMFLSYGSANLVKRAPQMEVP